MTNVLLISILVMVLITMISSIISTVVIVANSKSKELVLKVVKIIIIIFAALALISLTVGVTYVKKAEESKVQNVTLENAGFKKVTVTEFVELTKSDKKSIVLVARPTCSYCELFTPILKQAMDDMNLVVNYVDTDTFSEEDWTTFSNSLEYLNTTEWGTPLVIIVQNGKVVADNQGYVELDEIKTFFKENGFGE